MAFEIINYHYNDLERASFLQTNDVERTSFLQTKEASKGALEATHFASFGETVAYTIIHVFDRIIAEGVRTRLKALKAEDTARNPQGPPQGLVPSMAASPSPAASPAPAAPPPPPPTEEPTSEVVNVFVNFQPGFTRPLGKVSFLQLGTTVLGTVVSVIILDKPMIGTSYLDMVQEILTDVQVNGLLVRRLKAALFQSTGVMPKFAGLTEPPRSSEVQQWDQDTCETHMRDLVHMLEVAYTRQMVPHALYNECTNFIPSLSFSHDAIVNRLDRQKCRKATLRFAKRWNYGKADWRYGTKKKHDPMDFAAFCHDVCEIRFGDDSPRCTDDSQYTLAA